MNPTSLLRVLLTILGIFFIGSAIPTLLFGLSIFDDWSGPAAHRSLSLWLGLAVPLITIALGVGLVMFRQRLARRLEAQPTPETSTPSTDSLQAVGISIIGVFFVVRGAATLGSAAVTGIFHHTMPTINTGLAAAIAQLLLGLAVFWGASWIAGFGRKLRA